MIGDAPRTTVARGASRRPLVIEVMGPALAGKSTLIRTLCADDDRLRPAIHVNSLASAVVFASKAAFYFPVWLSRRPRGRWFTWREVKSLTFLDLWFRQVRRGLPSGVTATLLDHGPLYRLASLREFGPEIVRSRPFVRWWEATLARWRAAVDVVVWLDAPDDLLLERVERRSHWYLSADRSPEERRRFLERYRRALTAILEGGRGRPPVLRFSTQELPVGEIAQRVRAALDADADVRGSGGGHRSPV